MIENLDKNISHNIEYIPLSEAAEFLNTSRDYMNVLVRRGKLRAVKLGRNWVTTEEWIEEYKNPKVLEFKNLNISKYPAYVKTSAGEQDLAKAEKEELQSLKSSLILERERALQAKALTPEITLSSRELKTEERQNILETVKNQFKVIDVSEFQKASKRLGILKSLKSWSQFKFAAASLTAAIVIATSLVFVSGIIPDLNISKFQYFNISIFKDLKIFSLREMSRRDAKFQAFIFSDVFKNFPNDIPFFYKWLAESTSRSLAFLKFKMPSELAISELPGGESKIAKPQEALPRVDTLDEAFALDAFGPEEVAPRFAEGEGAPLSGVSTSKFTLIENRLSVVEANLEEQNALTQSELRLQKKTILGTLETLIGISKLLPIHPISTIVVQGQPATLTTYSVQPSVHSGFDRLSASYLTLSSNAEINGSLTVKSGANLNSLGVSGNTTLTGNATIGGTLNVAGDTTLGNLTVNGTISIPGGAAIGNASTTYLTVSNTAWINKLAVTGTATTTFNSPITSFSGDFIIAGDSANDVLLNPYGGNIGIGTTSPGSLLSVHSTGNVYFGGALTVSGQTNLVNASTTILTAPTFFSTTGTITNASSTNLTGTNFWSTAGNITNASTSALTINFSAAQSTSTAPFNVYSATSSVFSIAPSGLVTAGNFISTTAVLTSASSTNLTATNFWSTNGTITNASSTYLTISNNLWGNQSAFSTSLQTPLIWNSGTLTASTTGANPLIFATNSSERMRIDESGKVVIATTTIPSGFGLNIATSTFVYGNQFISGGLGVGIATTTSGAIQTSGDVFVGRNLRVGGSSTVIGGSSSDTLTVNSSVNSSLVPNQNNTYNLGSPSFYWSNLYIDTVNANNISGASTTISGTKSNDFTINTDNASIDQENMNLIFYRGTVPPNALLTWNAATSSKRFEFNQATRFFNESASTTNPVLTVQGNTGLTANLFQILDVATSTVFFSVNPVGSKTTMVNASTTNATLTNFWSTSGQITNASTTNLTVSGNLWAGSSGVFLLADGTVGNPSLAFASDIDTGLFRIGDNKMGFATGATSSLVLDNGKVIVGNDISTASYQLEVADRDVFNNTIVDELRLSHFSTGEAGNGLGAGILFYGQDSLGVGQSLGRIAAVVEQATSSQIFTSYLSFTTVGSGGLLEKMRIAGNGALLLATTTSPSGYGANIATSTYVYGNLTVSDSSIFKNASTTNGTVTNFWSTNGTITSASSTNLTGTNFWSTTGTITNASSTYLTVSNTAWINTLNLTNDLTVANGGTGASTLTGLLQGNGTAAITAVTGTAGQIPYYNGTNTLLATSTIFLSTKNNVGIASTSPYSLLSVDASANQYIPALGILVSNASGTATGLNIGSATSTILFVRSDGNIGIGTTAPNNPLQVVGNSTFGANFAAAGTNGVLNLITSDTTVKPAIVMRSKDALDYGFDFDSEQTSVGRLDLYGVIAGVRTQVMSWNRTGNVGIGTSTGLFAKATIAGSGSTSATAALSVINSASTSLLFVRNDGNVGIGTTTPGSLLSVHSTGNVYFGGALTVSGQTTLTNASSTNLTATNFWSTTGTITNASTTHLSVATTANFPSGIWNSSGSVGIGTTDPATKMHLYQGNLTVGNGVYPTTWSSGSTKIRILGDSTYSDTVPLTFLELGYSNRASTANSSFGRIGIVSSAANNTALIFQTAIGGSDETAGTYVEQMRITNSGNVGIGTTTPGALLVVGGASNNRYAQISSSGSGLFRYDDNSLADIVILRNAGVQSAASQGIGLRYELSDSPGSESTAGRIVVMGEQIWTSTASTKDSAMAFYTTADNVSAERFRITSTGSVGIASTSPSAVLSVNVSNATGNTAALNINSATSSLLFVRSDGNVGIGTTDPGAKLHIEGTSNAADGLLRIDNGGDTSVLLGQDVASTGHNEGKLQLSDNGVLKTVIRAFGDSYIQGGNVGIGTSTGLFAKATIAGSTSDSTASALSVINSASTSLLFVRNDGSVGIGTAAPDNKLDILGTAYIQTRLTESKTNATLQRTGIVSQHYTAAEEPLGLIMGRIDSTTSEVAIGGYTTSANAATLISFYTAANNTTVAGTERMRIDSAGNVGIGTTTPNVLGTTAPVLTVGRSTVNGPGIIELTNGSGASDVDDTAIGDIAFSTYFITARAEKRIGFIRTALSGTTAGDRGSYMVFDVKNNGGTLIEAMRINNSGFVGIGTVSPLTKLQVGSMTTTGGNVPDSTNRMFAVSTTALSSDLNNSGHLMLADDSGIAANVGGAIAFGAQRAANTMVVIAGIRGLSENATSGQFDGYLQFSTRATTGSNTEKMRITSGGSVGIGDTTPDEKLAVVGALKLADANARIYFGLNGGTSYRALEGATDGTTLQLGETFATTLLYGSVQGNGMIRSTGTTVTGATGKGVELQTSTVNGVVGGYLDAYDRTGGAYIPLGIDSSFIEFRIAGTPKVVIDASGMVGIGTTTPQVPLDVFSTSGMRVGGSINKRVDIFTSGAGNDINSVGGILYLEFDKSSNVDIENGTLIATTAGNVSINSVLAASGEVTICSTTTVLVKRSAACTGSDLPEFYPVASDVKPGHIVSITDIPNTIEDSNAPYLAAKSQKPYENRILGIMSSIYEHESPGEGQRKAEHYHLLALAGRVPVKISTEAGPIQIGDRITSSSLAGVGMTATSTGMTVGIALEPFDGSTATTTATVNGQEVKTGQILVFVNLGQPQLAAAKGTGDLASMVTTNSDLNMNGFSILNVKSISGMNGLWRIDEGGNITAQSVETQKLTVGGGATSGVTIYDRQTTAPKCIYIEGGVIKTSDGACGQTTNAGAPAEIIPASAPVPAVTAPVATSTPATTATTTPTVEPVATTTPILAATSTLAVVPAIEPVATTTAPMIILETATTTP